MRPGTAAGASADERRVGRRHAAGLRRHYTAAGASRPSSGRRRRHRYGATPADDGGEEAGAEAFVHEAVRDRMTAGGHEGEQVKEVHDDRRDAADRRSVVEDDPRLEDVDRRPADEELDDDDEEHLDDAALGDDRLKPGARLAQGADAVVGADRRRLFRARGEGS